MKITVVKEFLFDAAHYLPEYDGPCCRMHGHTYRLQIGVSGMVKQETGMVMDFSLLKKEMKTTIDALDHSLLNEVNLHGFPCNMPTAENMVAWLVDRLIQHLVFSEILSFVRLYETPTSYAEWRS